MKALGLLGLLAFSSASGQLTRPWVSTYNGQGDLNDRFTCVAKDATGNIYMGGSATNYDTDRDYLLVKLSASGTLLWRKELNNTGDGVDEISAVAVDASSNVYVTGFSKNATTGTDYRTVKYNSAGTQLWLADYNNPAANGYDQANAIAVDASGNVYVTGQSDGDPSANEFDDYATVKYNSSGSQQWVARYNGAANLTDRSDAIAVDASGNVYVTGRSENALNEDYLTIKYSALGAQLWTKLEDRGGRDRASAIALDGAANVYITGRSSNGLNEDFLTIKYNTGGVLQWQQAYDFGQDDRASRLLLDGVGNVYVTGQSDGDATVLVNWDYQTVAYSNAGVQVWQARFNGTASQDDVPTGFATDGTALYVTGTSDADAGTGVQLDMVTRSYVATSGALNWSSTYAGSAGLDDEPRAVIPTTAGCVVAGSKQSTLADKAALTVQYSASGVLQWQNAQEGAGDNNENVRALRVDASNNVYAGGYSVESRQNRNMSVVKFSSAGVFACNHNIDGSSPASPDEAQGIELTAAGEPVIAGYTKNSGESNDISLFKMVPTTCDTAWTRTIATAANGSDRTYDMTKDAAGNFYMTGRVDNDPSFAANDDVYTAKFNAAGTVLWTANYTSAGADEDRGSFVRVAASGNVYVTGRTWNGLDFDIFTIKYNNLGVQQWVQVYSGGNGTDEPNAMTLDASENIYITGRAEEVTPSVYNAITIKYTSAGVQQWAQLYNGTGAGDDRGEGITLDASSNVYVTGSSDRLAGTVEDIDIITLKYNSAGVLQWAVNINGPTSADDEGAAIAVNASGQICVTGRTNRGTVTAPNYDAVTMLYNTSGALLWIDTYNSATNNSEVPSVLVLNGSDFYVGGYSLSTITDRDMLVIKYTGTISSTPSIAVAPKMMLGGAYVSAAGLMRDDLRTAGLVPLTEPYTALGYVYTGSTGGTTTAGVLAITGNNAIVDWVVVELRSIAAPATVLESRAALVQRDGDVVAVNGTSPLTFSQGIGSYYIAVRHRNHLGIMTAAPVALGSTSTTVDLSLASTAVYGTAARQDVSGVQVLWSGNVFRDTLLKYTGTSNDRDPILVAVGGTVPTNTITGYRQEDINLDGVVKYTGTSNDRDPILTNIGGTTPTNTKAEQLP